MFLCIMHMVLHTVWYLSLVKAWWVFYCNLPMYEVWKAMPKMPEEQISSLE